MIFYITLDLLEFVFAWVSQIGLFVLSYILRSIVSLFTLVWKDLLLSLKKLSFCLSLNHTFAWFLICFSPILLSMSIPALRAAFWVPSSTHQCIQITLNTFIST